MLKPPLMPQGPGAQQRQAPAPKPGSQGRAPLRSRPRPLLRPRRQQQQPPEGRPVLADGDAGGVPGAAAAPSSPPAAWRSAVTDAHLIRPAAGTAQRRSHPPPAGGEGAAPAGRGKVKLQQQSCSPPGLPWSPEGVGGWV